MSFIDGRKVCTNDDTFVEWVIQAIQSYMIRVEECCTRATIRRSEMGSGYRLELSSRFYVAQD